MTSDTRLATLKDLAEVWELSPDVRLGQLLAHLGFLGEVHRGRGLGDIDDDEFMAIVQMHKAELQLRGSQNKSAASPPILPAIPTAENPVAEESILGE